MDNYQKLGKTVAKHIPSPKERKILRRQKSIQNSEKHLIPKTKFEELVKEVGKSIKKRLQWQPNAILALHTASEDYINELMEKSASSADHAKRRTTKPEDIKLVRKISKNNAFYSITPFNFI